MKLSLQQDTISSHLQDILQSYLRPGNEGLSIELLIKGHDYWWFLEFGTGTHFEKQHLKAVGSQVFVPEGEIYLQPPPSVFGKTPAGGYYEIPETPFPSGGGRGSRWLRFIGTKRRYKGKIIWAKSVTHPGIKPHMQLRRSILEFQRGVLKKLRELEKNYLQGIPDRDDLGTILNAEALTMHRRILATTPISSVNKEYWQKVGRSYRPRSKRSDKHLATAISIKYVTTSLYKKRSTLPASARAQAFDEDYFVG